MSCRIIGRNIEFSFIDQLISKLEVFKVRTVYANYIKTKKNFQVSNFYDKFSSSIDYDGDKTYYHLNKDSIKNVDYIKERE